MLSAEQVAKAREVLDNGKASQKAWRFVWEAREMQFPLDALLLDWIRHEKLLAASMGELITLCNYEAVQTASALALAATQKR